MAGKKILVTGAFGKIGGGLYCRLIKSPEEFEVFGTDRRARPRENLLPEWTPSIPPDHFMRCDLADLETACETVRGFDTVVHLAANANPSSEFSVILHCNVVSTYNVFEACCREGVKRVVYASSIMTSFGYFSQEPYKAISESRYQDVPNPIPLITKEHPVWPTEPYSASKVWGEALAKAFSLKFKTSFICIRIGGVTNENSPGKKSGGGSRSIWCSIQDITQLMECCIRAPESLQFDIFYGISENRYRWVDTGHAKQTVGFAPISCAEKELEVE